jgi:hypothetical protein
VSGSGDNVARGARSTACGSVRGMGVPAPEGKVLIHDGVGMLRRGDTCLIVYRETARLERTRWLFDVVDEMLDGASFDLLALLIVLPTAGPPDTATHQENYRRMRKIDPRVRRLVTVAVGDAFKTSIVRAVMRGLNVVLGHSGTRFVADSVQAGLARLLELKSPRTPKPEQLVTDLRAIYLSLGEPDPHFESHAG